MHILISTVDHWRAWWCFSLIINGDYSVKVTLSEIEEIGEESGRDECADEYPFMERVTPLSKEEYANLRRWTRRRGQARAQGLYELRGRAARLFSVHWVMGYLANCEIFERHLEEDGENHM